MSRVLALLGIVVGLAVCAAPLEAQNGGHKRYAVTTDRAYNITQEVLGRHGFNVVRIEVRGGDRIVYYRRGNMGRGRGKGPLQSLIIRRVENRIVFFHVPDAILADIDVRLRI
jgi:hypothetical protein